MGAGLISVAFTCAAVAASYFLAPQGAYGKVRIAAIWAASAVFAFTVSSKLGVLLGLGVIISLAAPAAAAQRVYLYVASLGALPVYYNASIPFPGLNYLIEVDMAKVIVVVLLGPVFIAKVLSRPARELRAVDTILIIYCMMTGLMSIRDLPFTSMLRTTIDQFLLVVVPYIAISRSLTTQKEIEAALKALLFSFLILAFIGVISIIQGWSYYADLADYINYKVYAERRNGLLRIPSTLNGPLLGYLMGVAVACLLFLRANSVRFAAPAISFFGLFFFTMYATGSRGGWLSGLFVLIAYFSVLKLGTVGRKLFTTVVCVGAVTVLILVLRDSSLISDKYGTFDYRAELLRTSIKQIAQRPIFGSADFLNSGRFEHLRQGEGIIDLVNAYLQISLYYGLSGLGLFLSAHILTLRKGLGLLGGTEKNKFATKAIGDMRRAIGLLIATQLSYLILIATVSGVSYIWHYGFLILGVSVAQMRMVGPVLQKNAESNDVDVPDAPTRVKGEYTNAPLPYGARFVRRP